MSKLFLICFYNNEYSEYVKYIKEFANNKPTSIYEIIFVDGQDNQDFCNRYDVYYLPTLMLIDEYDDGFDIIGKLIGSQPKEQIYNFVQKGVKMYDNQQSRRVQTRCWRVNNKHY